MRVRQAARLVYKSLKPNHVPANDLEYRELLALHRADPSFRELVTDVAEGLELIVLDVSDSRGMVMAPSSRQSHFALRLSNLRSVLSSEQKAALLLAHLAIAAVFFPTTEGLEDDQYTPPPASVGQFRDTLLTLARRLNQVPLEATELGEAAQPACHSLLLLPVSKPGEVRASMSSVLGIVRSALAHMTDGGLVRIEREGADDRATYTPRHPLRVQLRELGLRRSFELAQQVARTPLSLAHDADTPIAQPLPPAS
ncbi:MAG: hypothetical protein RR240_10360 [Burkholderiaceae bacterium]